MSTHQARCGSCGDIIVVSVDLRPMELLIKREIDRAVREVRNEGKQITMTIHDEIAEAIAPVVAAVEAVSADVARELVDFANAIGPKLSDDEKAQFASIAQKLTDLDASVNTADPAAPPVDVPPVDDSGDGSGAAA